MGFLYTRYYYPLREPIPLSHHLGFYLDNPRTKQEIIDVADSLLSIRSADTSYYPLIGQSEDEIDSLEWFLFRFRNKFIELDRHVRKQFSSYNREKVFEFIARMLVIARYPESESSQSLAKQYRRIKERALKEIVLLPGEYPAITNEHRLEDFSYLLSLLIHTSGDDYWGQNFVLRSESKVMDDDPWFNFMNLGGVSPHFSNGRLNMDDGWQWHFLPSIKEQLIHTCGILDLAFGSGDTEKLLYIGNLLKIVREVRDVKVKLLLLTSILELMLTHNPDYNRFNVEDSINKQFQLKIGVLMYMNDNTTDLTALKKQLKEIYQTRSNIAHGNFGGLAKIEKAAQKKKGEPEYLLERYVTRLYQIIRVSVQAYLRDKAFMEFLKEA